MLKRLIPAALIAGLAAGVMAMAVQALWLLPLIDFAEFLESGAPVAAYAPPQGLFGVALSDPVRLWGTFTFNVLTGVAYALMLGAAISLHANAIDWKGGLLWALGGWAVFALAPAMGQPPLPPGAVYIDLEARQIWWWLTVSSTAAGLALLVFGGPAQYKWWLRALGGALLLFPHVLGAPGEAVDIAALPGELARDFAVASIANAFVFWMAIGLVLGIMVGRAGGAPKP